MIRGSLGRMLVGNVLTTAAIRFPENESVVCTATGRRFRYRETDARSNRLAPAEVIELMRAMDAVGLIFEDRFEAVARQAMQALPRVRRVVAIGQAAPDWAEDYEALLGRSPAHEPEVELDESDPYYFNLTSGTTCLPKSYVLTTC